MLVAKKIELLNPLHRKEWSIRMKYLFLKKENMMKSKKVSALMKSQLIKCSILSKILKVV
jgi:hypothetical protein